MTVPGPVGVRLDAVIAALGRVTQAWLDRGSALRREAITALSVSTGFDAG